VDTKEKATLAGPTRPLGSPEIPQWHLPTSRTQGTWQPRLYGAADIRFGDRRRRVDERRHVAAIVPLDPKLKTIDRDAAPMTPVLPADLLKDPPVRAGYAPLPEGAMQLKTFTRWAKQFDRWLARTQRIELAPKADSPETVSLGPKRGGVSVELVAIVWELG
jgi:hypothetical protein